MLGSPQHTQAPDLIDPIIGWRTWTLVRSYGEWVLQSPDQNTIWSPGQALRAHCVSGKEHPTQAEREQCNCGINAFEKREQIDDSNYGKASVAGQVALWGEVTRYEGGWRGQWAKVHSLELRMGLSDMSAQIAQDLERLYGVQVQIKPPGDALTIAPDPTSTAVQPWSLSATTPSTPSPAPRSRQRLSDERVKQITTCASVLCAILMLVALGWYAQQTDPTAAARQLASSGAVDGPGLPAPGGLGLFAGGIALVGLAVGLWAHLVLKLLRATPKTYEKAHPLGYAMGAMCLSFLFLEVVLMSSSPSNDTIEEHDTKALRKVPAGQVEIPYEGEQNIWKAANAVDDLGLAQNECQISSKVDTTDGDSQPEVKVCRTPTALIITRPEDEVDEQRESDRGKACQDYKGTVKVLEGDPDDLDADGDGIGCED